METGKRQALTPKAIIHQRFGNNALYKVEEVQEAPQIGCPGLAIPQKGPCLYRCSLELPDFSVMSDICKKKKDAEQSAAKMALDKLGIKPSNDNPTPEEAWEDLISRIKYLFSNEFLSDRHPLSGHLRAALQRGGDLHGSVPVSVIAACDGKLSNLCKIINPKVESNPGLVISYILNAASRLAEVVVSSEGQLSIQKQNPYPPEIIESSMTLELDAQESIWTEAIHIPCLLEKAVEPVILHVPSNGYYMDVIAEKLGLLDANKLLVSRTIGKSSSETRLYFVVPKSYQLDLSSDLRNAKEPESFEGPINARASYFLGQDVCSDAILASIGYRWNSKELFHEDFTLQSYYRMLLSKIPSGIYKVSREVVLASELPLAFTTRANWRGSFPKEILCAFCRHHRLSEPVFASPELPRSNKKVKVSESAEQQTAYLNGDCTVAGDQKSVGLESNFSCEVRIYSKCHNLILECSPNVLYKKQNDAIQNASLKVLSWLDAYFKDPDTPLEKLNHLANGLNIRFYPQYFFKEFVLCLSLHNFQGSEALGGNLLEPNCKNMLNGMIEDEVSSTNIKGPDSGICPSNGSLICLVYSVSLVKKGELMKELIESNEEFEFEMGNGVVIPLIETVVTQMSVGQSACFVTELPPQELILAAARDSAQVLSLLSSPCCLEFSIVLLRVTEPPEDRMEQALFSPPLSKQRVEYALHHIKESCATSLVDFGCGSGSLLESLLDYPSSLETIVGIDISQKSLARAAKVLHSKLSMKLHPDVSGSTIKSAALYDGSITVFDSRFCGFDIGTCLEVIEHMEEDEASQFGDIVLSSFWPRILIVSTPNYEYNVILQRSNLSSQEDEPGEKTQLQSCKFRNHDHKFEWTREQFNNWASELATRHNYSVEFSGVGGSADLEPGFASQIAVFRRGFLPEGEDPPKNTDPACQYKTIWEWNRLNAAL
ncbi:hypothetical protein SLA2020_037010 [Shorea laevis]